MKSSETTRDDIARPSVVGARAHKTRLASATRRFDYSRREKLTRSFAPSGVEQLLCRSQIVGGVDIESYRCVIERDFGDAIGSGFSQQAPRALIALEPRHRGEQGAAEQHGIAAPAGV